MFSRLGKLSMHNLSSEQVGKRITVWIFFSVCVILATQAEGERDTMQSDADDPQLVKRILVGEDAAIQQLRVKYRTLVRSAVRRCRSTVTPTEIDDLEQDTWIAVWKGLSSFRGDSGLDTWIFQIARRTTLSWIRGKKAEVSLEDHEFEARQFTAMHDQKRPEIDELVDKVALEEIKQERLSDSEQEVIRLKVEEQLTVEEIAQQLEMPLGTVKHRLTQARKKLREHLGEQQDET